MARGTPTAVPKSISLFGFVVGGWAKLVGTALVFCNVVGAREPVRVVTEFLVVVDVVDSANGVALLVRFERRGFVESVEERSEALAVADGPDLRITENGYGSREVVALVEQQPPSDGSRQSLV